MYNLKCFIHTLGNNEFISLQSFSSFPPILSQSIYVTIPDMCISPSCLTAMLFWTGCSSAPCVPSSDTVGTSQLVGSIRTSGTVLSRCSSLKPGDVFQPNRTRCSNFTSQMCREACLGAVNWSAVPPCISFLYQFLYLRHMKLCLSSLST